MSANALDDLHHEWYLKSFSKRIKRRLKFERVFKFCAQAFIRLLNYSMHEKNNERAFIILRCSLIFDIHICILSASHNEVSIPQTAIHIYCKFWLISVLVFPRSEYKTARECINRAREDYCNFKTEVLAITTEINNPFCLSKATTKSVSLMLQLLAWIVPLLLFS